MDSGPSSPSRSGRSLLSSLKKAASRSPSPGLPPRKRVKQTIEKISNKLTGTKNIPLDLTQQFKTYKESRENLDRMINEGKLTKVETLKAMIDHVIEDDNYQILKQNRLKKELRTGKATGRKYLNAIEPIEERRERLRRQLLNLEKEKFTEQEAEALPSINESDVVKSFTLLLFKDKKTGSFRKNQTGMRQDTIENYDLAVRNEDLEGRGLSAKQKGSEIWDVVMGTYRVSSDMRAAHIVPVSLHPAIVDFVCGPGSATRQHTWSNCLMLTRGIEQHLDNAQLVIVPVDPEEDPITRWKISILDPGCKNTPIITTTTPSIKCCDIDGKELEFRNATRPALRFLYFKYLMSMLAYKHTSSTSWKQDQYDKMKVGHPWMTRKKYLRNSYLLELAKEAGDADEHDVARIMESIGGDPDVEEEDERSLSKLAVWKAQKKEELESEDDDDFAVEIEETPTEADAPSGKLGASGLLKMDEAPEGMESENDEEKEEKIQRG